MKKEKEKEKKEEGLFSFFPSSKTLSTELLGAGYFGATEAAKSLPLADGTVSAGSLAGPDLSTLQNSLTIFCSSLFIFAKLNSSFNFFFKEKKWNF